MKIVKEKFCPDCELVKPAKAFYKSSRTKSGLRCYCIACEKIKNAEREPQYKEQRKQWRRDNQEQYRQLKRNYYKKNKTAILHNNKNWRQTQKGKYSSYKKGAANRKLEFKLTWEEFLTFWQKSCYYCGSSVQTIGLDRLNPTMGYIMKNIVPCCAVCNKMKLDLTEKEFTEQVIKISEYWKNKATVRKTS